MTSKNLETFQKLVSDEKSGWLKKALWHKANKNWLDKSAKVAVNVLVALREKEWSQKDLAEKMNVSAQQINKIVKGQQNLTFETISKLEEALAISLMEIIDHKPVNEIKTNATQIKANPNTLTNELVSNIFKTNSFSDNFKRKVVPQMTVVYKNPVREDNYKKAI
jgi:transcriptional regulator with XRE-family HTH domain